MTNRSAAAAQRDENLRWCLDFLRADSFPPSFQVRVSDRWAGPFELVYLMGILRAANGFAPYSDAAVDLDGERITVHDPLGHRTSLTLSFDSEGRIDGIDLEVDLAGDLSIREVQDDDFAFLEEMEASAPIPFGDGHCHIKRHGSLRAAINLLGKGSLQVVENSREIVAVGGASSIPATIGGRNYHLRYSHHYRIRDCAREQGLVRVISNASDDPLRGINEGVLSVVHGDNLRGVASRDAPWESTGQRLIFECESIAGASVGRSGTQADAERIRDLINQTHAGEALFHPYDASDLEARFSRARDSYSWQNVRLTDGAVLGVWFAGEDRHYVTADAEWNETRAIILDYGFAQSDASALEALLRSCATEALDRGVSHITLFCSERAPAWQTLRPLAGRVESYFVSCTVPEPDGATERGIYIDPTLA